MSGKEPSTDRPLPASFGLALDPGVRRTADGRVLTGGRPGRLLTLGARGAAAVDALIAGERVGIAERALGRRLVEAGLAHPTVTPRPVPYDAVTVVIPVRDRPAALERCLVSVGGDHPIVVVDDGSVDPTSVAQLSARHHATLIRRPTPGGPAAARNAGLAAVRTPIVAFVDSDCEPVPYWLEQILPHLDDPAVVAAAPRVRARTAGRTRAERWAAESCPLDMGTAPAEVRPGGSVPYVPTAALVVHRGRLPETFDEDLRYGEDVDLVWRLIDGGWRVRYEPATTVWHRDPTSWRQLLTRRFHYGTSAAPLARRHGSRLAPLILSPWPASAALLLLSGRPARGAALVAARSAVLSIRLAGRGAPPGLGSRRTAEATVLTIEGIGRAATSSLLPVAVLAAGVLPGTRRPLATAIGLDIARRLRERRREPGCLGPLAWIAATVADDAAYGLGVWVGVLRAPEPHALLPSTGAARGAHWRPFVTTATRNVEI